MRGNAAAHEVRAPATLADALALLDREPGAWTPIAGGTDLMVLFADGRLDRKRLLSLWRLPELRGIDVGPTHVAIGALTTYAEIQEHDVVRRELPSLARAAAESGAAAIQSRGTLGGNVANGSPAADSPPALLAYDAEIDLVSASGTRVLPYRDFHTGYRTNAARPDELVARLRVPRRGDGFVHYYRKVGPRRAQAISKVCLAAHARADGGVVREIRVGIGAVAPVPLRCARTEAAIAGRAVGPDTVAAARAALDAEIAPIDDVRSTAKYRRFVAGNLLEEALEAFGRA